MAVTVSRICHSLDLAVRLIDTASGKNVTDAVRATINGKELSPRFGSDGEMIFINTGRADFEFEVNAVGFEPKKISVKYSELDKDLPYIEAQLIPGKRYPYQFSLLTLEGKLPGISEIDAVKIMDEHGIITLLEFDKRKRLLTVSNPYNQQFNRVNYAAVDQDKKVYEPFNIEKQISETVLKIKKPLEKPFEQAFASYRVTGAAENGGYLLRVLDSGDQACWIVRFVTAKGEFFQTVDLKNPVLLKEKSRKGDDAY